MLENMEVCQARPPFRALAANANTSSFASKIPTITEPVNDGVVSLLGAAGIITPRRMKLWPIGLGSNDDAFSMRVLGWHHVGNPTTAGAPGALWFPTIIGEFACIMGNVIGIAGSSVLNTEFFCDTITPVAARDGDIVIAAGTALSSAYQIASPTGDLIGYILMPTFGFEKIEFQFDQTTNTPTMNCLVSFL